MRVRIVSYSKWSITFNVSYQQMVDAAFISDAHGWLSIRVKCWEWRSRYFLGFELNSEPVSWEILFRYDSRAANDHVFSV